MKIRNVELEFGIYIAIRIINVESRGSAPHIRLHVDHGRVWLKADTEAERALTKPDRFQFFSCRLLSCALKQCIKI